MSRYSVTWLNTMTSMLRCVFIALHYTECLNLCLNRLQHEQSVFVWVTKCCACFAHTVAAIFSRLRSLSLSLMCFPCVLERQTQLHFNDTQMLLGFRIHVYACMCVCLCVRVCVLFDNSSESLLKQLLLEQLLLTLLPELPAATHCLTLCVQWVCSSENQEALRGISEQQCLPLNGLSASSSLTGHLLTLLPPLLYTPTPIHKTHTHINTQHTRTQTAWSPPEEMGPNCELQMTPKTELLLSDKWDKHTHGPSLPLTFSQSPSLTQMEPSPLSSPPLSTHKSSHL